MSRGIPFTDFQELCRHSGLAATHQRYLIFQAVIQLRDNPTPEEVFEYVRKSIPSISLATVYKNIDTFVNHRMLRDISPNYGSRRIESASLPHDHFVCRICRRVFDLKEHTMLTRPGRSDLPEGATFEYHLVEWVGLCRSCSARAPRRKPRARS
jgi:Fur family transcriptional regulator, peroxide stress response regulator